MARRRHTTERTEAGVRLVVVEMVDRKRVTLIEFRVTTLRNEVIQFFDDRIAAEAAFDSEVIESREDPRLGPIIS